MWCLPHAHIYILLNCVHQYTDIYDGISLLTLIGKWCLRLWCQLHIYLLLICVLKYTDIYDGKDLLTLNLKWCLRVCVYIISISF